MDVITDEHSTNWQVHNLAHRMPLFGGGLARQLRRKTRASPRLNYSSNFSVSFRVFRGSADPITTEYTENTEKAPRQELGGALLDFGSRF